MRDYRATRKKKKWIVAIFLSVFLLICIAVCVSAYQGATKLTVAKYEVRMDMTESIRIVQLTDLHGKVFGTDNDVLVQMVAKQKPDLILMTGDMMDKSDENADIVCNLIRCLVEVAPVYYGFGNHEISWMDTTGIDLTPILTDADAVVLNCDFLDISVKGQQLRIGGYYNYYRQPHMYPLTLEEKLAELDFADNFENTDRYKILLSHIPTAWLDWEYIEKYPVDLVLTGHYHGGQIRLPLVGGLYAPYVGLFPEYTEGMFAGEQATCILSTGLGSSPGVPRINNPPQIVVVDLIPEKV